MTDMLTATTLLAAAALGLLAVPVYAEHRWHKRRLRGRYRPGARAPVEPTLPRVTLRGPVPTTESSRLPSLRDKRGSGSRGTGQDSAPPGEQLLEAGHR